MDKYWSATKARFIKNYGNGTWRDIQRFKQTMKPGDVIEVWCDRDGKPCIDPEWGRIKRVALRAEIVETYPDIATINCEGKVFDIDFVKLYLCLVA